MENRQNERRHLSHHALVESAIRLTKQLASSSDIMTRSLANRMFSDLTLLRRGLPNRRQHEGTHAIPAETGAAANPAQETAEITTDVRVAHDSVATAQTHRGDKAAPLVPNAVPPAPVIVIASQTSSERHILQTRERIKLHPLVLCVHRESFPEDGSGFAGPCTTWELHAITPEGKPLGLLDFGDHADGASSIPDRQRAFELTAKCTSRPAHALYCGELMALPGAFVRHSQTQGNLAEWMLHVPDSHALSRNDSFWDGVTGAAPLGEAEFTGAHHGDAGKIHLRLWARRMQIPGDSDEPCWATCVVAQPIGPASEEKPVRLLTNRAIADLGAAAEIVSWQRAVLAFEEFIATDRETFHSTLGLAGHHLENWRMAQLAWHLEQELEVDASLIFSTDEIRAAHALARRSVPANHLALADMLTLLIDLGSRHDAETKLNAGLRRLADAVTGLELASE